ncbi:MAG TPA: penicillin-binding protein 2 [Spirochaetia bacterium]|nr:penicillin-binding protein 2 [Spirochaetia bacterium]
MEYGERDQKRRFVILTTIFSGALGLLVVNLFWLQIVKGGEFTRRARTVSERETPLAAQRGEIFDRRADDPLVFNVDSFSVDLAPGEVPSSQLPALFDRLAAALDIPASDIAQKVPPRTWRQFQPIEIRGGITLRTISTIAENMEDFPGVSWHNKPIRSYVESGTLAHVIGYVGDITREELQVLYNKNYAPGTTLGKSGVEKQYDDVLRGRDGKRFRVVDVKEKGVTGAEDKIEPPTPGQSVVLTIDRRIQRLAEQALGPRNGSVVVLKPSTGEILALASYPTFDPNRFFATDGSAYFSKLSVDPSSPFIDRAIQSAYPPGSTFKVIMTTGIVDDGTIPISQAVLCTGKIEFGDRTFNCWLKTGHGYEDLFGGLAQSCDVYFWTMGNRLGPDKILAYARDFGVGSLTGIDLPGEATGLLPTPEWKEKVKHKPWVGGDTLNISIGQGDVTLTPLQLADSVAMVVNEGKVYRPHILLRTVDPRTGQTIVDNKPQLLHESPISPQTFQTVQQAMRGVITKGTAAPVITTKAVEIAGKTGTAQVVAGVDIRSWHSWFAAYGPYETPNPDDRVVVVVMVEASDNWEWWAPKAANIIFQGIFANQDYEDAVSTLKPWYVPVPTVGRGVD